MDADGCLWKTIVVSGGQDRTVRVWDYQEHSLLLTHAFREDIFSLSLHPTGKASGNLRKKGGRWKEGRMWSPFLSILQLWGWKREGRRKRGERKENIVSFSLQPTDKGLQE